MSHPPAETVLPSAPVSSRKGPRHFASFRTWQRLIFTVAPRIATDTFEPFVSQAETY